MTIESSSNALQSRGSPLPCDDCSPLPMPPLSPDDIEICESITRIARQQLQGNSEIVYPQPLRALPISQRIIDRSPSAGPRAPSARTPSEQAPQLNAAVSSGSQGSSFLPLQTPDAQEVQQPPLHCRWFLSPLSFLRSPPARLASQSSTTSLASDQESLGSPERFLPFELLQTLCVESPSLVQQASGEKPTH